MAGTNQDPSKNTIPTLLVTEIYPAILGESAWAGWPGVIVRLTGCNLRCSYCDTTYAYAGGKTLDLAAIIAKIKNLDLPRVLVTGGEPLMQPDAADLMRALIDRGLAVMLETNGALDLAPVPAPVHVVMDLKTPGSGEHRSMNDDNLKLLKKTDEIKVVLTNRRDYLWARKIVNDHRLDKKLQIIFSPAFGRLDPADLARWILKDRLHVRLGLQIHKYIFGPDAKRV
jgi:7-carboxy-7-deazaguanine synthase